MKTKHSYALQTIIIAAAANTVIFILIVILQVFTPINFFFITWKTIGMLLMPLITLAIIIRLWVKNPNQQEEEQKMGRPRKQDNDWEKLGIEQETSESNIIGEKNPFDPEKVLETDYDFPNQDPELYQQTDEDVIIEEKPVYKQSRMQPQQQQRPMMQAPPRSTYQQSQQQQRPMMYAPPRPTYQQPALQPIQQQQEELVMGDEEEIMRLTQKYFLLKKQLALVHQKLAEYGVNMK